MSYQGAVILAAGEGTRMKTSMPKVLNLLCGKPLIGHVLDQVEQLVTSTVLVLGFKADEVKRFIGEKNGLVYVYQQEQKGTGDAVKQALGALPDQGQVLVLYGDTPFLTGHSLRRLFKEAAGKACAVLTAKVPDPSGYGRIVRGEGNSIERIVEEAEATVKEKEVSEINIGSYCFELSCLKKYLPLLPPNQVTGEYYLTDVILQMRKDGHMVSACLLDDYTEGLGINDLAQLAGAAEIMRRKINHRLALEGVTIIDPGSTYIDAGVTIGNNTIIYPQTIIEGDSCIGSGCRIGPSVYFREVTVEDGVVIRYTVAEESILQEGAVVGPFAYLRPGTSLGPGVKIGDFVEVKNSRIETGTKVPHLSYIGDADVGSGVNIGAGVIVVNYDGKHKHRTRINDGAFVGCNSNLISPITIGEGSYVAAGSTLTGDVPDQALALARSRQVNKSGLARRLLKKDVD